MVDSTGFYFVWVLCCVFYVVSGIRRHRQLKRLHNWASQHAPLTGAAAANSRLDGALRDAEEGCITCAVCEFGNLKRRIHCLLCGSEIRHNSDELKAAALRQQSLTWRQRRARLRNEWQRVLDENNEMRWTRVASPESSSSRLFQAYKLEYVVSPIVSGIDEAADEPEVNAPPTPEESVTSDQTEEEHHQPTTHRLKLTSIRDVDKNLRKQLETGEIKLLDGTSADPSRLGIHVKNDCLGGNCDSQTPEWRRAEYKALIEDSKLPFPSKLVQFITRATAAQHSTDSDGVNEALGNIQLRLDRDTLLDDSIQMLAGLPPDTLRGGFRIAFCGETGVDAGGVYREWLLLLNKAIIAPEAGIFTFVDSRNQSFYLNPNSQDVLGEHHLAHFLAAGRLLGRVLLEGYAAGFHLALPLLKIVLGEPVGLADLEFYDPDTYKSLLWLLESDDAQSLGLNFTVTVKPSKGTVRVVELIPGGKSIDLTDANKREYVDRKLKYLLFESIESQLFAFLRGIYDVVPVDLLALLNAEELDHMLSGSDEIDVDDWEKSPTSAATHASTVSTCLCTRRRASSTPC